MADISSFTHKWRAIPNNQNDANKISKRNRQPVSCQPCQRRKLKCDRGHPCEACSKRGDEESCNYGKVPVTTSTQQLATSTKGNSSTRAQDRLRELEEMVRRMIEPAEQSEEPSDVAAEEDSIMQSDQSSLTRDRHATNYKGSTHWSAILDQIHDLRTLLTNPSSPGSNYESARSPSCSGPTCPVSSDINAGHAATRLFAAPQPPPLGQLLHDYLPPRRQIDRLLSIYFNAKYTTWPFIHTQQFGRQYEAFWADTNRTKTSPMWLSMLFSIICLANNIKLSSEASPEDANGLRTDKSRESPHHVSPNSTSDSGSEHPMRSNGQSKLTPEDFITASAQLLIIGDYTRPQPHLIEALLLHVQTKYALSLDPNRETSLIFPLMVRQAYAMSYHRDCSNFLPGQFTVFEAEMRRRLWASVKAFDCMVSFQLGIPTNIAVESYDTKLPRNLEDSDFDEDSKSLPEPRPETEPTFMLYFVTKARILNTYTRILRHSLTFSQSDGKPEKNEDARAEVMKLDEEVRKIIAEVPTVMRVRPMSLSFSDPGWLIMLRTNIMFVLQKSLCVLHRKYMMTNEISAVKDTSYSRTTVVEAATTMVNHFFELHNEFQPNGQLSRDKWMLGSFLMDDYLLASMLLCFVFWMQRRNTMKQDKDSSAVAKWLARDQDARAIFDLLERSKDICDTYSKKSSESHRVAEVLAMVVTKINEETKQFDWRNGQYHGTAQTTIDEMEIAPGSQQQYNHAFEQPRLDITPLSISGHDSNTPNSNSLSTNHMLTPQSDDKPVSEHAAGAWNIVEAVPYGKRASSQRGQPRNKQAITFAMSSTTFEKPSQSQQNSIPPMAPAAISAPPTQSPGLNPNAGRGSIPDIHISPFKSLLDSNNDSPGMDWATFDQFLNNFNPNLSTGANLNSDLMNSYDPYRTMGFPPADEMVNHTGTIITTPMDMDSFVPSASNAFSRNQSNTNTGNNGGFGPWGRV